MKHYVGLDGSLKETSICVVDGRRRVVEEGRVGSEAETIAAWLVQASSHLSGSSIWADDWRQWDRKAKFHDGRQPA